MNKTNWIKNFLDILRENLRKWSKMPIRKKRTPQHAFVKWYGTLLVTFEFGAVQNRVNLLDLEKNAGPWDFDSASIPTPTMNGPSKIWDTYFRPSDPTGSNKERCWRLRPLWAFRGLCSRLPSFLLSLRPTSREWPLQWIRNRMPQGYEPAAASSILERLFQAIIDTTYLLQYVGTFSKFQHSKYLLVCTQSPTHPSWTKRTMLLYETGKKCRWNLVLQLCSSEKLGSYFWMLPNAW